MKQLYFYPIIWEIKGSKRNYLFYVDGLLRAGFEFSEN